MRFRILSGRRYRAEPSRTKCRDILKIPVTVIGAGADQVQTLGGLELLAGVVLSLNRADILGDGTCVPTPGNSSNPGPGPNAVRGSFRKSRAWPPELRSSAHPSHALRRGAAAGGRQGGGTAVSRGEERRRMFSASLD
jgi:hypothetical protein